MQSQYQHFIPRFILRRFQVGAGLYLSKAERRTEFLSTGVDPEYVQYYDVATGKLDVYPIGKVYGVLNFYQDVHSTENINELEVKLGDLERQASSIIRDVHDAHNTLVLNRCSVQLLLKFMFIMHYRNVSCSCDYFQVDHPDNARSRQWIESFMKLKGIQSAVEVWIYFLRYYLDKSHKDIMQDATDLLQKYGEQRLQKMIVQSHIPFDLERYPAFTYQTQAENYFPSFWEAAKGEEFILTPNGFGLWQGLTHADRGLYCISVVSPRIAFVLCNAQLCQENTKNNNNSFNSSLLDVKPAPATLMYTSGEKGTDSVETNSAKSSQQGENDSFVFKFTKLTRSQTLALNTVGLANMKPTGSLTFLSKSCMLRTARAFHSMRCDLPESDLVVRLIERLTADIESAP